VEQINIRDWRYQRGEGELIKSGKETVTDILKLREEGKSASVPGSIYRDLQANGEIPEPFFGDNELKVRWVEEEDWIYTARETLPAAWLERLRQAEREWRVDLVCEGVDTFGTLFVNGYKVGRTDNAFIPWRFSLPRHVIEDSRLDLLVYIESSTKVAERLQGANTDIHGAFDTSRAYVRRPQYLTGWDWGPRLSGAALWRPVRLELFHFSRIDDVMVRTKELHEGQKAVVEVHVETETFSPISDLSLEVTILDPDRNDTARETKTIKKAREGERQQTFCLEIERPRLWFPRGYGEQPLYNALITLQRGDETLDQRNIQFGIRTVRLLREKDEFGESFVFSVNNTPVFCKGYNWIPADIFPGTMTTERYHALLEKVVESNANCLRIWGGGIYEDDVFYETCDRLGIMVWQDFMFACSEYPEDEEFLTQVRNEAETIVKRLRSHPAIILWCGNNENEWMHSGREGGWKTLRGLSIYTGILPEVCKRLDPDRPYWQSSPFGGDDPNSEEQGDRHNWNVWSAWNDMEKYLEDRGRFISEFGFQSLPHRDTVASFAGEEYDSLTLADDAFTAHQKQDYLGNVRLLRYLLYYLTIPRDMNDFIYATQVMQAEALKTAVEHWRSRKFLTAGSLVWQFNDCWPVISWSVLDYFQRPKAAWYFARRFFAPLLISLERDGDDICCAVVNDSMEEVRGEIVLEVRDSIGDSVEKHRHPITLRPNEPAHTLRVGLDMLNITDSSRQYVRATLESRDGGGIIARNRYFLSRLRKIKWDKPGIEIKDIRMESDTTGGVVLTSRTLAKSVEIACDNIPLNRFSDNFFDLDAGEEKCIKFVASSSVTMEELRKCLYFRCLNDLFSSS